ncbi:putative catabolite repression protein creC [Frankliniella fusca]|uniref:Catabolite repression protein creC n=1 Tax=Frankliniella fusca TaxID=407009 RepID=A0AAE1GRG3_9NEOP|nr:putative catabolite repression protein creC [Frankliniella fusca]
MYVSQNNFGDPVFVYRHATLLRGVADLLCHMDFSPKSLPVITACPQCQFTPPAGWWLVVVSIYSLLKVPDCTMSDNLKRPGPVNIKADNIQKSWETFKQKFGFYQIANGKTKAAPEVKFALLMREPGDEALEVNNSFKDKLITKKLNDQNVEAIDVDNSTNYDHVLEQFDQYEAERK